MIIRYKLYLYPQRIIQSRLIFPVLLFTYPCTYTPCTFIYNIVIIIIKLLLSDVKCNQRHFFVISDMEPPLYPTLYLTRNSLVTDVCSTQVQASL